ncbi:MAG: pyruvate:ferredoxin (flavodoxin) oxidoreductase [Clostridia bacterium]|nr:pyruvate:ferredoxin (flavodoxin) oxidoreductase [Clostridia bacterium]
MDIKNTKTISVDGNTATANIAYKLSEVSAIYPITPSSTMAEQVSKMADDGKTNIFGNKMIVKEMQSEAGASGAVHGSLTCGALATTFTASQGLLLMIPNMYKIAGELLPCVFHVSARAVATHALSIFGDHSDVMAVRQTGFAMLASSSVQECQDMALASHIATLTSSVPFIHFFDGFRTSHEIQKIQSINDEDIKKIYPYDKLNEFKSRALDPLNPIQKGTAQNPDIFFQNREACNMAYSKIYDNVIDAFNKIESITGRKYEPFEYFGCEDAQSVIVIMGSGSETVIKTVKKLAKLGQKVGVIRVRLYRPFNYTAFIDKLPKTTKNIAVLDRTKESTSPAEPLCEDVIYATYKSEAKINIVGGRYGLGSKEFTPSDVVSVFDNLKNENPLDHFSVGINDDVTNLSLPNNNFDLVEDCLEYKFFGLGSDGTVSANKNTIKIIGEETDNYVQGYFEYDSKKSGSLTTSHLRVSKEPIQSPYLLQSADFIAIHNFSFVGRYDLTKGLKSNGVVLLNTALAKSEVCKYLPEKFVLDLKNKNAKLYIVNAQKIADDLGLGGKINIIMQTAFFKLSNVIEYSLAKEEMIEAIKKTYGKKGDSVVNMNIDAINQTEDAIEMVEIGEDFYKKDAELGINNNYYNKFIKPIESLCGNDLPVSSFNADGSVPTDTSKFLKRGVASKLPCWQSENCIQCGLCAVSCPHSVIKAKLIDEKDLENTPDGFKTQNAMGVLGKKYKLQISPLDCTGCGVCSNVCPAKNKALVMKNASDILEQEKTNYDYFEKLISCPSPFPAHTPKGLQFEKSYFEFSGACAGCGETPYITLASKLFGKNMIIANATGCSSIYGGNAPVCPYSKDADGCGPAWANSLFEDNAEYGYGMSLAINNNKQLLKQLCIDYLSITNNDELKTKLNKFIDAGSLDNEEYKQMLKLLKNEPKSEKLNSIITNSNYFTKKSIWIIGGDGWAYDIGYGGLDHILASKENVNILVLDSEVYSNTGGQASKSTQKGATAKFALSGKDTKKKDLGLMAMSYKNAYVASISLGADSMQAIKAFKEAESYNGPSLIIAYSPCINHGFDMSKSNEEMKKAVLCGYWNLYRFNPTLEKPLTIDSKEPSISFKDFILGESRFSALNKVNPELAQTLFKECENDAKERRKNLTRFLD